MSGAERARGDLIGALSRTKWLHARAVSKGAIRAEDVPSPTARACSSKQSERIGTVCALPDRLGSQPRAVVYTAVRIAP
jgi:hypothetical protein